MDCAAETASPLIEGSGLKSRKADPILKRDKRRISRSFVIPLSFWLCLFDVTGSSTVKQSFVLGSGNVTQPSCGDCPDVVELGELKACVHTDSIAQLITQDALLAVIGQLEQVEAR